MNYTPAYGTGSVSPESAQKIGLGTANNILANTIKKPRVYPENYANNLQGPATADYADNQTYTPMKQVSGLMGGDYNALQTALEKPILDYSQKAKADVGAKYAANGLYGSAGNGLMSSALADVDSATANALSNAVASRYNLQLQDQQQQINQNKDVWTAGAATTDQVNRYNADKMKWDLASEQTGIDFNNMLAKLNSDYESQKDQWQTGVDELNYQRALQMAGLGNSGAVAANELNIAKMNQDAQETAALYGGVGDVVGGLMGSYDSSGDKGWNFSNVWNGLTGLF